MVGTLPLAWGATPADLARVYPADTMLAGPVLRLTRAVPVDAPSETVWRWLCQIAVLLRPARQPRPPEPA